jgi:hypothetical protein
MLARERCDQPRTLNGDTREGGDYEAQEKQSDAAVSDAHARGRRGRSRGRREGKNSEGQEQQSEGGFSSASTRAPVEVFGSFIYGVPGHWDDDILEKELWGAVSKAVAGSSSTHFQARFSAASRRARTVGAFGATRGLRTRLRTSLPSWPRSALTTGPAGEWPQSAAYTRLPSLAVGCVVTAACSSLSPGIVIASMYRGFMTDRTVRSNDSPSCFRGMEDIDHCRLL